MKYCSKCVMPETAESLLFKDNACSVCNQIEFKQTNIDWSEKKIELDKLINEHKNKYDYDCIVPFSGGKDSTFTLYYLVKNYGLKPLVVQFNHGFLRPTVLENNNKTFSKLGVDVMSFTPNWQVVRKLMFESLLRRGDFCWHCHTGIFSYPMQVALKFNIPLLFWGEPGAEYSSFYSYEEEELADERRFNRKINLGINAEDMIGMLDNSISDYQVDPRDLKPYQYPSTMELIQNDIKSVFLGSFIPWNVRDQVELIKNELGWKEDKVEGIPPEYGYEKIECYMQGVRDYIKFLKRGFGRTTHLASIDIRNGKLSREKGLDLVKKFDGKRPHSLDWFLKLLGITEEKFNEIIENHTVAPNKFPDTNKIEKTNVVIDDFDLLKKKYL